MLLGQGVIVILFVCIHLFTRRILAYEDRPRDSWLSFAGGSSVAYVFLHILPELNAAHDVVREQWDKLPFEGYFVYAIGLCGIVLFYGLERIVKADQREPNADPGLAARTLHQASVRVKSKNVSPGVFWIHIASFAIYNSLIGYLLIHGENESLVELVLFAVALGFHFLVNDFALREQHREAYHDKGRWVLAAAVLVGWILGLLWAVNESAINILFAFLAGSIILNVLKEELPETRQSQFIPFTFGVAGYGSLILLSV